MKGKICFRTCYQGLMVLGLLLSQFVVHAQISPKSIFKGELDHLSYKEIQDIEIQALDAENWDKLKRITQLHLSKAKAEKNEIEVARAYYYRTIIETPEIGILYADSIIMATEYSSHPNYPTLGYSLKGHLLYNSNNFQEALEHYLKAYNLALEKNNYVQQQEISLSIAAIRNINGQHYAAADLYRRSLKLLEKEREYRTLQYDRYMTLLYNLSLTHLRLFEVDSAQSYVNKGIEQTFSFGDKENYKDFVLLDAQIQYYNKNYGKSRDTLLKYVGSLTGTSKAIKFYYLGKIEEKLGNKDLAVNYYRNIDSIVSTTEDPFAEVKDVYQQLIMYSLSKNDKHKQIEYIEKLIRYDSILASGQEDVLNRTMVSYDIPFLKYQKKAAEKQLQAKDTSMIFAGVLAGIGLFSGFYFQNRNRKMRKKIKILLEEGSPLKPKEPKESPVKHPSSVPEDIRLDILKKLEIFEASERFLDKDLDMSTLAQELGTNTSYFSTVINHYKQMSFPKYLKDLRITKAINQLSEDPQLLKYNFQGLADEFGFKTSESFSKAFNEKTGVPPSKFINELKIRKTTRHL